MVSSSRSRKLVAAAAVLVATAAVQIANAFVVAPSSSSAAISACTTRLFENVQSGGHDVTNANVQNVDVDQEELKIQQTYAEHQQNAAKLDWATDVRTLVEYNHGFAVLSTISKSDPGYPGGSVVGFAPDEEGRPLFCFSKMSSHTSDLGSDPKCSLTVASKEFKGAADGRVNLMGTAQLLQDEEEIKHAREVYLKKHPNAFWVDFGDFKWFRLEVEKIRFVGGFARAGSISASEYKAASPDEISSFGMHIANHMNEDHQDSTIAMVADAIPGMVVSEAIITSVDSLGMYIKVTRTPRASDQPQQFKLRLPFPRPCENRKDAKTIIVEMTQKAAKAAEKAAGGTE